MSKIINLELLSEVKSKTSAFLETRKPLNLTPAELSLLGIRNAPEVVQSSVVLLKCDYRSHLNDRRRDFGYEPLEPQNDTLPWGEWEIEDALLKHEDASGVRHYLRYYESIEPVEVKRSYYDAVTGEKITGVLHEDIDRYVRRRNKRCKSVTSVIGLINIDTIVQLYTLDGDGEPDLKIIETQLV